MYWPDLGAFPRSRARELGSRARAGVAQLVEHDVANVVVVGSNPITRSIFIDGMRPLESGGEPG